MDYSTLVLKIMLEKSKGEKKKFLLLYIRNIIDNK